MHRSRHLRIVVLLAAAALVLPAWHPAPAGAGPLRVTQVTVKDFGTRLVVGVVATGPILFQVTTLSTTQPPRVAVDVLNAVVDEHLRTTRPVNKGNVLRVRVGQFQDSPPIARVVIDLVRPVPVDVQRSAPHILVVSVPLQAPVTEGQARAAAAAPVPEISGPLAPAVSAAPGTGVVRTAQQLPTGPQAPGLIRLLEFRGVALADVLSALSKLCAFNMVTDSSVQGTITLRLVDVTCEDALRFILEANGLAFRRLGKNIIISSAEKLAPPPEVPETIAYRLAYGNVDAIRSAVAAAVPGIRVAVDTRTNSLLITGTSAQHEEVVKVLGTLDVRIPQVMIQAHAIDIASSVLRELGLLSGVGGTDFGSFFLDSAQNRILFQFVDTDLILFRLQALVTENRGRILAAPRITTLDGNKATILLGDRVPIFTVTTQAGVTTTTVTFVEVGVKLEVTPRVNADGLMTLTLRPEVSSVAEIVTGPGGQQAPRVATRSAETVLTVRDGQTIVLGGLISQEERRTLRKVPLLGDIPIIGELFRSTSTDIRESEVVFLITPQILKDARQ
ncbi:MAG: secretin N-terminal domain-containing protein [Armatimonadota bacterium]|nr:secretin N-terminal domain-containing protein [Armatimonadota bacterium]MDR7403151.1 secretin N-terminal domain-containing protein [Armatimonadota bacterium]